MPQPFTGVVLTGGRSRRMGTDKAFVEVDGVPLAARVRATLVDAGAAEVIAVGGDASRLEALGFATRPDDQPGGGPAAATVTALRAASHPVVVVVACDLPRLDAATVMNLLDRLEAGDADVVLPVVAGREQYLCAAYRRRALAPLEAGLAAGHRSMQAVLAAVRTETFDAPRREPFRDADTPDDLA